MPRQFIAFIFIASSGFSITAANYTLCPVTDITLKNITTEFNKCYCEFSEMGARYQVIRRIFGVFCNAKHFKYDLSNTMLKELSDFPNIAENIAKLEFTGNHLPYLPPNIIGQSDYGHFQVLLEVSSNRI